MEKRIRIKITADGLVEVDSSVFKDCREVAEHLTRLIGRAESFEEKDEHETTVRVKVDSEG
jgi:hypothetical protein